MTNEEKYHHMSRHELIKECVRLEHMLDAEHKMVIALQDKTTAQRESVSIPLRMPWGDWNS